MPLVNIQPTRNKWVLEEEQNNLCYSLNNLNINYSMNRLSLLSKYNYISSRYMFNRPFYIPLLPWQEYFFDYFHGGLNKEIEFEKNLKNIVKHKKRIKKIRVSSSLYKDLLINKGLKEEQISLIPIPVNTKIYFPNSHKERQDLRRNLNIQNKFIIGSFQKDGIGWDDNSLPKLIKGPDIFIETVLLIKRYLKNIFIIITGKSRHYVIKRLKEIDVPFIYLNADNPEYRAKLYNILDLYLITSREEGGPKGFLESLACQTPVITTNVGQVHDLGIDKKNCFKIDSFNPEDLFSKFKYLYNLKDKKNLYKNMLKTAKENSVEAIIPKWKLFFEDF